MKRFVSANGAAKLLGITSVTFKRYVLDGKIQPVGILLDGRRQVFDMEELLIVKGRLKSFKPFRQRLAASGK